MVIISTIVWEQCQRGVSNLYGVLKMTKIQKTAQARSQAERRFIDMKGDKKVGLGLKAIGQTMNPKLKQGAPETLPVAAGVKSARMSHKVEAKSK
jgi:hypothetical protein